MNKKIVRVELLKSGNYDSLLAFCEDGTVYVSPTPYQVHLNSTTFWIKLPDIIDKEKDHSIICKMIKDFK